MRFDAIAMIHQVCEAMREMGTVRWDRIRQSAMQITTVKGIVRCTESLLDCFAQRGAEQNTTIIPAPLVETGWLNAFPPEFVGNPQPMQNAGRIRTNIDAGAYFAERSRLFIDLHVKSRAQRRRCRGEASDASTNDPDRSLTCNGHIG
jgi:hypothetical protein